MNVAHDHGSDPVTPVGGLVLMALVTVWSGALAVGFGFGALTASDRLGVPRTLLFALLAVALAVIGVRTGYELGRRARRRRRVRRPTPDDDSGRGQ